MDIKKENKFIIECIDDLEKSYQENQALIISESDLKCQLYLRLFNNYGVCRENGEENIKGPAIHTELSWFNKKEKLNIIPDISIMDPNYLRIITPLHGKKLPSKNCVFYGSEAILFELKFIKFKSGITINATTKIQKDIDKIKELYEKFLLNSDNRTPFFCYFLVFTKVNKRCKQFEDLMKEDHPFGKVIVCSGNVVFDKK